MTLDELNAMDPLNAEAELRRCCGSRQWAARMARARPFASVEVMRITADIIWAALDASDWREAFAAHPAIGAGRGGGAGEAGRAGQAGEAGRAREARGAGGSGDADAWSAQEQQRVASASSSVLDRLAEKNREYEARFGYIFIVCATGKTADDMLAMLERRLTNDPATEIRVAADEQRHIMQLRLGKLMAGSGTR